ncbi:MAG: 7TM diverse intracellular signaling domain-containing protein [Oligoflexus sp.]
MALEAIRVNQPLSELNVFPFQYFVDQDHAYDIKSINSESIPWLHAKDPNVSFGYTSASYWLRFVIQSNVEQKGSNYLQISYPLHDIIEIYLPNQSGDYETITTGDNFPFSNRQVKTSRFLVDLDLNQVSGKEVFIRINSESSMRMGMRIISSQKIIEENQVETAIYFLFYGTMAAMILYNLLLYISVGETSYLYYVVYILSHTLFQMSLNGHVFQFLLPDYPFLAAKLVPALVGATSIGIGLFTISFLNTARFLPVTHLLLKLNIVMGIVLVFASFFLPYRYLIKTANLLPILFSLVCLAAGFFRFRQGYQPAAIYLAAFTAFFIGVILASGLYIGIFPSNFLTEYGAQLGSSIEVILLSIALGNKINIERKNRYLAQQEALNLSKEKEHSYDQMSKVVYPHQVSLIQKGMEIETTMPTGIGEACILSFDIMASSKVNNEGFSDLMEEFLIECRELMMRGYAYQDDLRSTAYMIKEMGDGFLCSVGYPFKQLGESKAVCAVELALEIVEKFDLLNRKLDAPMPVNCCIGIAMGNVKAYFSKSGSIKHDMWGDAIVLATRYEGSRKPLMEAIDLGGCNLIILHEKIYNSLPENLRCQFEKHKLEQLHIKIRDDVEAQHIIFKAIKHKQKLEGFAGEYAS